MLNKAATDDNIKIIMIRFATHCGQSDQDSTVPPFPTAEWKLVRLCENSQWGDKSVINLNYIGFRTMANRNNSARAKKTHGYRPYDTSNVSFMVLVSQRRQTLCKIPVKL